MWRVTASSTWRYLEALEEAQVHHAQGSRDAALLCQDIVSVHAVRREDLQNALCPLELLEVVQIVVDAVQLGLDIRALWRGTGTYVPLHYDALLHVVIEGLHGNG